MSTPGDDDRRGGWWPGLGTGRDLAGYLADTGTQDRPEPGPGPGPSSDRPAAVEVVESSEVVDGKVVRIADVRQQHLRLVPSAGDVIEAGSSGEGPVAVRTPAPVPARPVSTLAELTAMAAEAEVEAKPRAVRVRGWAGRGPVSLVAVKPPRLVREQRPGQRWWSRLARWVSGGESDGRPLTDATWWRFATAAYAWSDRQPARWWSYPRAVRSVVRWLSTAAAAGVGWLWWTAPEVTSTGAGLGGWVVLAATGWAAADSGLSWPHRRRWVWPAVPVVAPILGYPRRTPPRRFLYVPQNFARAGGQVEVALPPGWIHAQGDQKARELAVALRRVLSLADVEESWHVAGRNHFLVLRPAFRPPVPGLVAADDPVFVDLMGHQPWSAPLLGLGAAAVPVAQDFASDNPHLLVNGQSNSGKSRLLEGMAAQMLHQGWAVVVCDYKFTSLRSLRGLPQVTYARWIEQIHCQLVALGQECERRNRIADALDEAGKPEPQFEPLGVFIEEINATVDLLRFWWETHRRGLVERMAEERGLTPEQVVQLYGDPRWKISPAKVGLRAGLSIGRERRIHLIGAAQHATTNALGGPEIREQFGQRMMGRATAKAWQMLAPDVAHPPNGPQPRGRWHLVQGDRFTTYQAGLWTPQRVRAYATSGERVTWSHGHTQPAALGNPELPVTRSPATTTNTGTERDDGLVTLKEASVDEGRGLVDMTIHMLNKQRHTDPAFPAAAERPTRNGKPVPGRPYRYRRADLAAYVAEWKEPRP